MNDRSDDRRFHAWLTARAPRPAPPGLLARSMDAVEAEPTQRGRWPWSASRAVVLVPALATLVTLTVITALIWGLVPRNSSPVGEATRSPTETTSAVPSESPTESESPTASPSPTSEPTPTQRPTPAPIVFPSAHPSPTPPIVGAAGTLTLRLALQSLPTGTQRIRLAFAFAQDVPLVITPADGPDSGGASYTLCGGATTEPCSAPRTYEQIFSGFEPNGLIYYDLAASDASGATWHFAKGQLPASGYLIAATYPTPDPEGPRASCIGDLPNHRQVGGTVQYKDSGPYTATEDLCLTSLIWSMGMGLPSAGTVSLTRDGQPVYAIDLAHFGAGLTWAGSSGEFMHVFNPAIPVYRGQVLNLDFSECRACGAGSLGSWFEAAAP